MTPAAAYTPADVAHREADARNRAVRSLLQGAAYTVGLAVVLVIYNAFKSANGWGSFDWSALGFSSAQAAVVAGLSYLMRAVLDPSRVVPTPLPPEHPGEPAVDDDPRPETVLSGDEADRMKRALGSLNNHSEDDVDEGPPPVILDPPAIPLPEQEPPDPPTVYPPGVTPLPTDRPTDGDDGDYRPRH